jgi:hypothetical protein
MLMLVVLVVGGWLGWIAHEARVQREAVAAIMAAGGKVHYDWAWTEDWDWTKDWDIPGKPGWLRRQLGPGFFEEVMAVWVFEADDSLMDHIGRLHHLQWLGIYQRNVTDSELASIAGLADLRSLTLGNSRITDAGLASIAGLPNLQRLYIEYSQITDAGLVRLSGLKHCRRVYIRGRKVTPAGIAAMQAKCPWMTIFR